MSSTDEEKLKRNEKEEELVKSTEELEKKIKEVVEEQFPSEYKSEEGVSSEKLMDIIKGLVYGGIIGDCIGNLESDVEGKFKHTDATIQTLSFIRTVADKKMFDIDYFIRTLCEKDFKILDELTRKVVRDKNYKTDNVKIAKKYSKMNEEKKLYDLNHTNGALKRSPICGLFSGWESIAAIQCMCTHISQACISSCVLICSIVRNVVIGRDMNLNFFIQDMIGKIIKFSKIEDEDMLKDLLVYSSEGVYKDLKKIDLKNDPSNTYKCMASSLWGLNSIVSDYKNSNTVSFSRVLDSIKKQGGDTVANCALTGSLAGCYIRYSNLPKEMLRKIENFDEVEELLGKFFESMNLSFSDSESSLVETNTGGASLEGASLEGASLEGASLEGASLEGAGVEGADAMIL